MNLEYRQCLLYPMYMVDNIPFLIPLHAGDDWCQLLVDGPMSRPVCHLILDLTPAECGVLLNRVCDAERLEELTLEVSSFQCPLHLLYYSNTLWSVHDTVSYCL